MLTLEQNIRAVIECCFSQTKEELQEIAFRKILALVNNVKRKGKWIPHPNKEFREWDVCTACGTGCKRREYGTEENGQEWRTEYNYPFCPHCGANMNEEE